VRIDATIAKFKEVDTILRDLRDNHGQCGEDECECNDFDLVLDSVETLMLSSVRKEMKYIESVALPQVESNIRSGVSGEHEKDETLAKLGELYVLVARAQPHNQGE